MKKYETDQTIHQDCLEFVLDVNGQRLNGILGKGIYFNWISFPKLGVSCELSHFSDVFWNQEQLLQMFDDPFLVNEVSDFVKNIESFFEPDEVYFDGKRFVNTKEYIFWLESHCEACSNQLIKMEILLDHVGIDYGQTDEEMLNEYQELRKQYGMHPLE